MKPCRAVLAALLLSYALGAAAAMRVAPVPAARPAPTAFAAYQAGFTALDPSVASAFLADGAARAWTRANHPEMYASSLLRAHEIKTLETLPAGHREAFLRRELIAVETLPLQQADTDLPARHRAAYGSKKEADRLARAANAWDTLAPEVRKGLGAEGAEEDAWRLMPISMRAALIASWWEHDIFDGSKAAPGTREHLALVRRYARKAGGQLTDAEATELSERLFALERMTGRLPALRAEHAADPARLAELDAVAAMARDDAPKALARLDKKFGLAPSRAARRFVHDPSDPAQKRALASLGGRLEAAFKRLAAGTSAELLLARAAGRVQVGGVPAGSDGAYQVYTDRLALPADVIDWLLRDRDARFEDLATDDALLERLAVMYLPVYVHETTHRLQGRAALKMSLTAVEKGVLYGHEDEHEAYLAQELFVREFATLRPELAAWARAIPRVAGIWDPKVIRRYKDRVSRMYADVPGGHGRRAQGLMMAITESGVAAKLKPRIERELARRRNQAEERRDPVRMTEIQASSIRRAADRLLRRWRDIAAPDAARFADMILSYLDEGDARVAELKRRLRAARRTERR